MKFTDEQPKLGSETDLTVDVSVHPSYDRILSDTAVKIELAEGITLVNGNMEWTGDLTRESPRTLNARVKFSKEGDWTLKASAKSYFDSDSWYESNAKMCFSVFQDDISMKSEECQTKSIPGINELLTEPGIDVNKKTLYLTDPFKGTFEGSDEPKLNSAIKVIFSFTPNIGVRDADIKFYLPVGVTLLEGETEWNGYVASGQKIELPIEVKIASGENYIPPMHVQVSGNEEVYEKVSPNGEYSPTPTTIRSYYYEITDPESYEVESAISIE